MDAIVIKDLVKTYGDTQAVKGISFSIKQGEIFGFLGPNGAGKTTTINCISQLATPSSGTIVVEGFDTKEQYLEAKHQLGLSSQELMFDLYFSVWNTLIYQGGFYGLPKKEAEKRAAALLKEFAIDHKKDSLFRELSGGMKRKASIAKAMMHEPKVLILDEPTAGLDVDSRYDLWEFILGLKKKGLTIVLTTHYIEEAEKLCDRIGIINKGEIKKLQDKKALIEELSRNVIVFEFKEKVSLPKDFVAYENHLEGKNWKVHVSMKEQSRILEEILDKIKKQALPLKNFTIQQDSLENIFRRIIDEN